MKQTIMWAMMLLIAQGAYAQKNYVIFSGGANYSSLWRTDVFSFLEIDFDYLTGYYVGIGKRDAFSDKVNLDIQGQFSTKGTTTSFQAMAPPQKLITQLQYINLLTSLEYRFIKPLGVYGGFHAGYLAVQRSTGASGSLEKIEKESMGNRVDLGLLLGLRAHWKNLELSFHANPSLTPLETIIFTDANGTKIGVSKSFNNSFQLGLAYALPL